MNNILVNQNRTENLAKLAAQRQLYRDAKWFFKLQILFTVPVTILLSLLKLLPADAFDFNITTLAAGAGGLITLCDIVVTSLVLSDYRKKAATIQDQFDCDVYEMDRDVLFTGKSEPPEVINRYAAKYVPDLSMPLENWYPVEISDYPKEKAIYTCQRTNSYYDRSLRDKFVSIAVLICVCIFLIILTGALLADASLNNFLVQVFLPFLPVFTLTLKIVFDNRKSIRAADEVRATIAVLGESSVPTMAELRTIQNKIYCARKDSALVPEFFYKRKRSKLEKEMHANA